MAGHLWTEEENAIVREYYAAKTYGTDWLKEKLPRRTIKAIYLQAHYLHIHLAGDRRRWGRGKVFNHGLCVDCQEALPIPRANNRKRCPRCTEEYLARGKARLYARALRQQVIEAYGSRCACCGDTHWQFLELDHIDGDGAAERKRLKMGKNGDATAMYRHLRKNGFPKDRYRLLCSNCNAARGRYGYCPHERERAQSA